jgi:FtsH-binding integral membrane protein
MRWWWKASADSVPVNRSTDHGSTIAQWLARFCLALMVACAASSVFFVQALKPSSESAFDFFTLWLASPDMVMAASLLMFRRKKSNFLHLLCAATIVSATGVILLADVIFWHRDAQGAIAVLMVPISQVILAGILIPMAAWVAGKRQNKKSDSLR